MSAKSKSYLSTITSFLEPLELLYLAIAIATFNHTQWASAYLFEGAPPSDLSGQRAWWLSGALIAIAVDVGMLITSRMLQNAQSKVQIVVLAISFIIAALTSFYAQVTYISFHTPEVVVSPGVSAYWEGVLQPLLDARVIILPLALPVLATVFTIARIYNHRRHPAPVEPEHVSEPPPQPSVPIKVERELKSLPAGDFEADLQNLLRAVRQSDRLLEEGHYVVALGDYTVNLQELTWHNSATGKSYGPYKNINVLYSSLLVERRRRREEQIKRLPPPQ